jgi:hypothetical protein
MSKNPLVYKRQPIGYLFHAAVTSQGVPSINSGAFLILLFAVRSLRRAVDDQVDQIADRFQPQSHILVFCLLFPDS